MTRPTVQIEQANRALTPERAAALDDTDPSGEPIIRPHFHHVNLKTTQRDAMVEWYRCVVGVQVVTQTAGGTWLSNDESNHRLALVTEQALGTPIVRDPERLHDGLLHTAWEFATVDDLLATYERLERLAIVPRRAVNHGPTLSFYYTDPDGNQVELQCDTFGDWSMSLSFMQTSEQFEQDPFGPDVDPALMLSDRRNDISAEEVLRRSYTGTYQTEEQRLAQERRRQRTVRG